jgi:hypothetical protein
VALLFVVCLCCVVFAVFFSTILFDHICHGLQQPGFRRFQQIQVQSMNMCEMARQHRGAADVASTVGAAHWGMVAVDLGHTEPGSTVSGVAFYAAWC